MKKKLLCLTLSILMLLACVFTSCSTSKKTDEGDGTDEVDNSAKTIVMWVVTDEETDPLAAEMVNDAFTKITKAKFKTNVVIKFCTEDEYYDKLEAAIEAQQKDILMQEEAAKELRKYLKLHKGEKPNDELTKDFYKENPKYAPYAEVEDEAEDGEDVSETAEETETNEYGISEIKYPDEKPNQVDIFYLSGYDKYMEFYQNEWLASLNEELSTSSKKLNHYISTSLLNGVQIEGGVYAIPNNVEIGEYTYMLVDKKLFDDHYQKIDKVNSVLDLASFLNDVKNLNVAANKTAADKGYIVPLASTYEECAKMLCWYWDLSYTDQSVYETYYDADSDRTYVLKIQYEVKTESTDENGETVTNTTTMITQAVKGDTLYKTNADGKYVDKDGNVLNYSYKTDSEQGWIRDEKTGKVYKDPAGAGALYLVDENGDAVKPENDRRVEIDGETKTDADGYTRPTYYYSYNTEADFSILGAMMKDAADRSRGEINLGFNSLFTNSEYREMYATLKDFQYKEFYGEVKEGQTAAVSFVKGDARIKLDYEKDGVYVQDGKEYYVVVAEYPEATEEELYGNMFAVYANSNYLSRSMEVITYLNTNKELRNLLQYGIEGKHYTVVGKAEEGQVARLLDSETYGTYRMDIAKTGNCFIALPPESMGADAWTYAKSQNNDSLVNPLLGFDFNKATADSDYSLDVALIDHIAKLNAEALDMISECTDKASLLDLLNDSETGFAFLYSSAAEDAKLNKATNPDYDPEAPLGPEAENQTPDKSGSSPYTVYYNWLTTYGYLYEAEAED